MHRGVTHPKKSSSVSAGTHDIELWECDLEEYYRAGGAPLDDRTKLLTAHDKLLDDTNSVTGLIVKNSQTFSALKKELREVIKS